MRKELLFFVSVKSKDGNDAFVAQGKLDQVRMDIFVKMKTYPIRNGSIFDPQLGEYVPVLESVKGAPLSVWLYLATCVNDAAHSWPGRDTIAESTGYTKRTVTTAISRLKELGLIAVANMRDEKTNQAYNLYTINNVFFEYGKTEGV